METLADLRVRRAIECRLAPGRELRSLTEAREFLDERGLLTRTPDCALPSLYEACQEEPYQAGGHGFASWPATKWPWFGELGDQGYLITAIHRGKNLLITDALARLIDPIARAEIARLHAAGPSPARLLDHLAAAGPSQLDDLRTELGLSRPSCGRCALPWSAPARSSPGRLRSPPATATCTPANWPAGTRPTRTPATRTPPRPRAQGPDRGRRARRGRRAGVRAPKVVRLAVVLDRPAHRRPDPRRAGSAGWAVTSRLARSDGPPPG